MLDDHSRLGTAPREDGIANSSSAGVAVNSDKPRGGGSGGEDNEWPSSHPVDNGASCIFNDRHDNYDEGERFLGGAVRREGKFDKHLTVNDRDQGGSPTEGGTSTGSSGGSRPSSSYAKRPRFNAAVPVVGGNQGMQHQRDASIDAYMFRSK